MTIDGDGDDLALEAMEFEIYEASQAEENLISEFACCDCGYLNATRDGHHPEIRCPETKRCGQCGNNWPCSDHLSLVPKHEVKPSRKSSKSTNNGPRKASRK
jgi:hypothetical protein